MGAVEARAQPQQPVDDEQQQQQARLAGGAAGSATTAFPGSITVGIQKMV